METDSERLNRLARDRKTVRRFKSAVPPIEDIYRSLETVRQAPSGSNMQPWRFVIIDDPSVKAKIRSAAESVEKAFYASIDEARRKAYNAMGNSWKKPMLEQAPYLIAVVSDTRHPNFLPSVWLAVGYLVLALEAVGLSSVTYTPSENGEICSILALPEEHQLETILPIGYSDDPKKKAERRELKEFVYRNCWGARADIC